MYLINAYRKDRSESVALHTAQDVISRAGDYRAKGFKVLVLDDRGREVSPDQLASAATSEDEMAAVASQRAFGGKLVTNVFRGLVAEAIVSGALGPR